MDIANALADLLDDVDVPLKELVLEALYLYSKTKPDYAGCIYKACRTDDNQKPFWIQKDQSINEPSSKFIIAL